MRGFTYLVAAVLVLVLLLGLAVVPVNAGSPYNANMSVDSDIVDPISGKTFSSHVVCLTQPAIPDRSFTDAAIYREDVSWIALLADDGSRMSIQHKASWHWTAYVWSGLQEARNYINLKFDIPDPSTTHRYTFEVWHPNGNILWRFSPPNGGVPNVMGLSTIRLPLERFTEGYRIETYAAPVPEPSGLAALSAGLLGLVGFIRRRR